MSNKVSKIDLANASIDKFANAVNAELAFAFDTQLDADGKMDEKRSEIYGKIWKRTEDSIYDMIDNVHNAGADTGYRVGREEGFKHGAAIGAVGVLAGYVLLKNRKVIGHKLSKLKNKFSKKESEKIDVIIDMDK